MLNFTMPKKLRAVATMARELGESLFRPISRKYDRAEHSYPVELDMLRAMIAGMDDGGQGVGAGGPARRRGTGRRRTRRRRRSATAATWPRCSTSRR